MIDAKIAVLATGVSLAASLLGAGTIYGKLDSRVAENDVRLDERTATVTLVSEINVKQKYVLQATADMQKQQQKFVAAIARIESSLGHISNGVTEIKIDIKEAKK